MYCTVLYCTGQGGDEADNWDYDGSGDYDMGDYKPPCVGACAILPLSHSAQISALTAALLSPPLQAYA